jgi:hypothetical protein
LSHTGKSHTAFQGTLWKTITIPNSLKEIKGNSYDTVHYNTDREVKGAQNIEGSCMKIKTDISQKQKCHKQV